MVRTIARSAVNLARHVLEQCGLELDHSSVPTPRHASPGRRLRVRRRGVPIDLWSGCRDRPTSVDAIMTLTAEGRTVVAAIEPQRCRQAWWFSLSGDSPLVNAARAILRGDSDDAVGILASFYQSHSPANAADRLGISSPNLAAYSPYAAPMPWDSAEPKVIEEQRIRSYKAENDREGLGRVPISALFGPVPMAKVASEVAKLTRLIAAVQQNGYARSDGADGDVKGYLLCSRSESSSAVRLDAGGNHRAAVLTALGWPVLPIRISPRHVVLREHSGRWHQVREGVMSERDALDVFDRIVAGVPPRGGGWIK